MTYLGSVTELWRYPVKSMQGQRRSEVVVAPTIGISGDRGWAVRDETVGEIRGARKIGELVRFAARYLEEPEGASTPPVEIIFPDGERWTSDDEGIATALSSALDRAVTLWPRRPAEDHEHYRRAEHADAIRADEQDYRAQLGLLPDEPLPDYSTTPAALSTQVKEFVSPPGTYFDLVPLTLLTTSSMRALAERSPGALVDPRRFRPNVVLDSAARFEGFVEADWIGWRLRIGSVVCEAVCPTSRCVIVTLPQADLPRDRSLMRTLVRETSMRLGINLDVIETGTISEGDAVELL